MFMQEAQKMSQLTDSQVQALHEQLDQREQQLQGEVRDKRESAEEQEDAEAGVVGDPGDHANLHLQEGIRHVEMTRDVDELRAIDAARERLRSGWRGDCEECGVDIDFRRLQAQPTAVRCAPCQELYERTHDTVLRDPTP
jgi:DnaK suppressor protein